MDKEVEPTAKKSGSRNESYVKAVLSTYIPAWYAQRQAALYVDPYLRGGTPFSLIGSDQQGTREREQLKALASTPYARTILNSSTQSLNITGFRNGEESNVPEIYKKFWLGNRMEARQNAIWRPAVGYGCSYTVVLPGTRGIENEDAIVPVHFTPKTMTAFFAEQHDEYPVVALNGEPQKDENGIDYFLFTVYDDEAVHFAVVYDLVMGAGEDLKITYLESRPHGVPVCPVVYHTPLRDDDGGSKGEIVPFLPIIHRLDQSVYDRLLIQRQAAWKTRTISNIEIPNGPNATAIEAQMRAGDLLTSKSDAKFGTLDASSMLEHVETRTADLKDLATASQTPSYMVTGESTNIQAEGLAAITSGFNQKIDQYKRALAVSIKQIFQLASYQDSGLEEISDDFEIRWADPRPYSLTQVADALGKLSQQLQIDPSLLYEQIPFFSDNDVTKAIDKMQEAKDEALAMAQADAAAASSGSDPTANKQAQQKRTAGTAKDSNQNSRS